MMVCVAETEEEAFAASTEGLCYFINFYTQRRPLDDGPGGMPRFLMTPEILRASAKDPNAPFAMFIGNPEQVAAQFQRIKAGERGRITHLPLAFRHAGMRTDVVRRSMQLFHKHVLPILKA
jgi:alkanesulfonate monooxygenase SsuD/methylene tetrahydromethanopterin reductase-like flavin-dependent oxidoreductase (luciferase family)